MRHFEKAFINLTWTGTWSSQGEISPRTHHSMCSLIESIGKSGGNILNVTDYPEVVGGCLTFGEGGAEIYK